MWEGVTIMILLRWETTRNNLTSRFKRVINSAGREYSNGNINVWKIDRSDWEEIGENLSLR